MARSHLITIFAAVIAILLSFHLIEASSGDNETTWQEQPQRPLPPGIIVFPESLHVTIEQGNEASCTINLSNNGNENLIYNAKKRLLLYNDEETYQGQPWELIQRWNVADSIGVLFGYDNYDVRINGICLIKDKWYIIGDNFVSQFKYFYLFNREGGLIDTVAQPIAGRRGYRDVTGFNDLLYCISNQYRFIYELNPSDCNIQNQYAYTSNDFTNITSDPETGCIYVSSITTSIYKIEISNDSTNTTRMFRPADPRDGENIRIYGLAWFPEDPDGCPLYLISDKDINDDDDAPDISLYKVDPETRFTTVVDQFQDFEPYLKGRCGICISTDTYNWNWVFAAIFDSPIGDEAVVYNLGPNIRWINIDPAADTLRPNEDIDIIVDISSEELRIGNYLLNIEFFSNAQQDSLVMPLAVEVTPNENSVENRDELPSNRNFEILANYPNPFNSTTTIFYNIQQPSLVKLTAYDFSGREVGVLVDKIAHPGRQSVHFDAQHLPAGVYFYRLEMNEIVATRKMILVR